VYSISGSTNIRYSFSPTSIYSSFSVIIGLINCCIVVVVVVVGLNVVVVVVGLNVVVVVVKFGVGVGGGQVGQLGHGEVVVVVVKGPFIQQGNSDT